MGVGGAGPSGEHGQHVDDEALARALQRESSGLRPRKPVLTPTVYTRFW